MKTVSPTELRKHLSNNLRYVRSGNEVVIVSRGEPLARILPIPKSTSQEERELVAAGLISLPKKPVKNGKKFVDRFLAEGAANVSRERRQQKSLIDAVIQEREESW